jgi:hypothetical protein
MGGTASQRHIIPQGQCCMLLNHGNDVILEPVDEALYSRHFAPHGLRRGQYLALMRAGGWREYCDGQVIARAGDVNGAVWAS